MMIVMLIVIQTITVVLEAMILSIVFSLISWSLSTKRS
jgi:hypothetical protein